MTNKTKIVLGLCVLVNSFIFICEVELYKKNHSMLDLIISVWVFTCMLFCLRKAIILK